MTDTQPGTEVARVPISLAGPQLDFDATYRLAKNIALANLMPDKLRGKPNDVLVTILYGQELGIAPMQAVQSIYVVDGKPTISAHLWVALARKAGHKVRVTEETEQACTVAVTRYDDPEPVVVTYTMDDAKRAKLTGKNNWQQHPAAMLYARAVSTACRRACPEIALGFGDETERHVEERPSLAQVAAERADRKPDPALAEPLREDNETVVEPEPADPDAAYAADLADIEREHLAEYGDGNTLPLEGDDKT